MHPAILETRNLTARFGGHVAVDAVSCTFNPGEITAIVGPNGAGKTTYFNVISGQVPASAGAVFLAGRDITRWSVARRAQAGLGRAFQLTNLFPNLSVFENLRLVVQARQRKGARLLQRADSDHSVLSATQEVFERVRLTPKADQLVTELTHGDQRKLEFGFLAALDPVVFMFDEPTAGMSADDAPVILEMIASLRGDPAKTVLLVEHKLDVIRTLADRIIVLNNGVLAADGAPADVIASDVVQDAYLGRTLADV
ncbi:ABC transporter ATP-binding protein [Pseudoruegeria sp. SK021]|uniref:ABC transporter ATP-binding protein n=1 Tax=Pseudoruegeria sp. SK021 TaxID=1933035 RepID=UPI000A22CB53|nr:ABC transporter ATP-binding protein [Pseudoruegeria sp. SK021]OSP55284.1 ABC transporter ATP-binding protein [Pseudoruegeria sp. SK021]